MAAADVAIAEAEAKSAVARAARWPRVTLGVAVKPSDNGGPELKGGLSVNYDLATGGQVRAAIDEAEANVAMVRADREALRRDILQAMEFLRADTIAGADRLSAARQSEAANAANAEAVAAQFDIGRRTILDVLQAQRALLDASETVLDVERQRTLDRWSFISMTGEILLIFGLVPENGV